MIKYGKLTYLNDLTCRSKDNHILSSWRCDCGNLANIIKTRVVNGRTKSCGCLALEAKSSFKHGFKYTKEYRTWGGIKARCHNEKNKDYIRYGAKGIVVCEEWRKSFVKFFEHMGYAPTQEHQIDRINTKGNYEPNNCRWATAKQQCRNTVSSYTWYIKGVQFETSKEAGSNFSVTEQTIHKWVKGYYDKRRGTYRPKTENCYVVARYKEEGK